MQNKNEDKHPLQGIMGATVYKGVWVEPYVGGYFALNHKVKTIKEVDELIREAALIINNSI